MFGSSLFDGEASVITESITALCPVSITELIQDLKSGGALKSIYVVTGVSSSKLTMDTVGRRDSSRNPPGILHEPI